MVGVLPRLVQQSKQTPIERVCFASDPSTSTTPCAASASPLNPKQPERSSDTPSEPVVGSNTEAANTEVITDASDVSRVGNGHEAIDHSSDSSREDSTDDSSIDELAPTPLAVRTAPDRPPGRPRGGRRSTTYTRHNIQELKMDTYRTRSEGTLRRSARYRKSDILGSDTIQQPLPTSKRRPGNEPKLDTARARLRDDIAQKTRAKASNFLVANKHLFLPLLPEHNYVSKLVARDCSDSTQPYKRLKAQPQGVTATMKPYQLEGLSFLVYLYNNGFSGILADEMGLGKTLQTLSLFQYLEEQDSMLGVTSEELRPYLVVCPLSVLNSWVNEAQKWVPNLKVLRFHGTNGERDRLKRVAMGIEDQFGNETSQYRDRKASTKAGVKISKTQSSADSYKIIVTTYETFHSEQKWFKHAYVWRYIVLDEGHKIKGSETRISAALRHIMSEYRLILTGTPLQNNLLEMWALLAWLYPDVFTENTRLLFKDSFDLTRGRVNQKTLIDARKLLELIMLRRMKDSPGVDLGLPPKEEVLLYVPLTPMQRFWYLRLLTRVGDAMLDELFVHGTRKERAALEEDRQNGQLLARIEKPDAEAASADNQLEWEETAEIMRQALEKEKSTGDGSTAWRKLMNLVMQLRKCCSHPYLLPGALPDPYHIGRHVIRASGKFILLEKLLKHTIFTEGKKVLIFSGFTQTLDYCEDMLSITGNFGQDFKFLRLDGATVRARRNLDIRLFNDPKSPYKAMLLSTRAGGLGINLTSAETVIFLDEDWNPQVTLQAEARAHRIGQMKKVTIYKLCTQGTVEEQMMGRIRKKLYLSAKVTESMRSIHGARAPAISRSGSSRDEDVPELSTTQLKSLVRRGAQTLSHPEINANEMLSWDLDTMIQKCRDKPMDVQANVDSMGSEVDEEQWLSVIERVECAVLDGKRYQRNKNNAVATNILPASITREDRRKGKNTTVMVDGFAVNKESLGCADWEAVPTMAGKDPRLAEPQRRQRRQYEHEEHCVTCFDGPDAGHMVECKTCPRSYHFDCLEPDYQVKVRGFAGFHCPQHTCYECGKSTSDAGGLIYRCRWCPNGFCEDCLEWGKEELIGENLPEFEMMGEEPAANGFYIKCPGCVRAAEEDKDRREWMLGMETSYGDQYKIWLKEQEQEQVHLERQQDAVEDAHRKQEGQFQVSLAERFGTQRSCPILFDDDDDDGPSPPALTDTSTPTPLLGGSGVNTPRLPDQNPKLSIKRATLEILDPSGEVREEKRARLDEFGW